VSRRSLDGIPSRSSGSARPPASRGPTTRPTRSNASLFHCQALVGVPIGGLRCSDRILARCATFPPRGIIGSRTTASRTPCGRRCAAGQRLGSLTRSPARAGWQRRGKAGLRTPPPVPARCAGDTVVRLVAHPCHRCRPPRRSCRPPGTAPSGAGSLRTGQRWNLRRRITAGEWAVDEALPAVGKLAESYEVSLGATVPRALRELESDGLARAVPRWGVFRV
jgi:hypothetical protein